MNQIGGRKVFNLYDEMVSLHKHVKGAEFKKILRKRCTEFDQHTPGYSVMLVAMQQHFDICDRP